jgi:hypothetical protein
VVTPCPAHPASGGWCQTSCPSSRSLRALYLLWLRHYQAEGRPDGEAHALARRSCRAHYPEVSRAL